MRNLLAFDVHLGVYIVVNTGLWLMDIAIGGGLEWAYWTTIGWGIGVAAHGTMTFFANGAFTESWRGHKEAEYVARMRGLSTKD
ncbi:MAG: 2TM domain-containing protein [Dehalococcoidia bacterium]|nr:2TM domain-containing protein [Dehalococcoidia bacterium]